MVKEWIYWKFTFKVFERERFELSENRNRFQFASLVVEIHAIEKRYFLRVFGPCSPNQIFFEHAVFTEMSAILAFNSMPSQKKIVRAKIEKNPKRSVLARFGQVLGLIFPKSREPEFFWKNRLVRF